MKSKDECFLLDPSGGLSGWGVSIYLESEYGRAVPYEMEGMWVWEKNRTEGFFISDCYVEACPAPAGVKGSISYAWLDLARPLDADLGENPGHREGCRKHCPGLAEGDWPRMTIN